MSTPFMGQMEIFAFNFPPKGWAQCNGQLLPINQNQALFSLFGTNYGGDGRVNFALPDLRGRVPISVGSEFPTTGQRGGEEFHTLIQSEMPQHNHPLMADATTAAANASTPGNPGSSVLGISNGTITPTGTFTVTIYNPGNPSGILSPAVIGNSGGSQAHENRMPFLVLNFCVALQGIFPSQN
jgi:microcystin-dependent protein